jgi:hypothetical protein
MQNLYSYIKFQWQQTKPMSEQYSQLSIQIYKSLNVTTMVYILNIQLVYYFEADNHVMT